jgi:hypothetical protein
MKAIRDVHSFFQEESMKWGLMKTVLVAQRSDFLGAGAFCSVLFLVLAYFPYFEKNRVGL